MTGYFFAKRKVGVYIKQYNVYRHVCLRERLMYVMYMNAEYVRIYISGPRFL